MGFCLENYFCYNFENDGDNGSGGGYSHIVLLWLMVVMLLLLEVMVMIQLYIHITAPQLVSLGWDDMYHPQYVSSSNCVHFW